MKFKILKKLEMNFTKLVLGDALGDMDLGGLSLLGFEENVDYDR